MKTQKFFRRINGILLAVVMLCGVMAACTTSAPSGGGQSAVEEPVNLIFSNHLPAGNALEDGLNMVHALLAERSGGTITIEYFPGGTLLSESQLFEGVITGTADIGNLAISNDAGRFPYLYLLEYPGVEWGSAKAASYALREFLENRELEELSQVKVLSSNATGPGIMLAKNRCITDAAGYAGMTIRTIPGMVTALEALGATPITMPIGDVYESLRTGILDGFLGTLAVVGEFKFEEQAPYLTYFPFYNATFYFIINWDVWNSLSANQQTILQEVFDEVWEKEWCDYHGRFWSNSLKLDGWYKLKEVAFMTDEETAEIENAISGVLGEYADSLEARGYNAHEVLEYIKELAAKYNNLYPYEGIDYIKENF